MYSPAIVWNRPAFCWYLHLPVNVALLQVRVVVVKESVPVVSVLGDGDLQPGFKTPAVVDDSRALDFFSSCVAIPAKPKNMPPVVKRHCLVVEDKLTQWQASSLP